MNKNYYILAVLFIGLGFSSCNKKKWAKTADISIVYAATTNTVVIAGKDFVMDELSVSFSKIELSGDRLQADYVSISNAGLVDVNFISPDGVGNSLIALPQGTFDEMEMPLSIGGNGEQSVRLHGEYFFPNGDIYQIEIALAIDTYELLAVLDNDNETTILIEEGSPRNVKLTMNPQQLFSEVNPGLWNAAAVTSVGGAQTMVVDELNNESVYYALLAGFSTALTAKFE
ncbi:MAG: hypothetical protein ACI865_001747 [Flavobacteriaceae bacterium]|jgi:hypothetical protein